MATVTDVTTILTSKHNHIDALLDDGPDWNYLTPGTNVLFYTFSVTSGNEDDQTGQVAFTASQQAGVRAALAYVSALTGIVFTETSNGTSAQVHFANIDITSSPNTSGLCSWQTSYSHQSDGTLVTYSAQAWIYLDNKEWATENGNVSAGSGGYETLLHEIGHMLGLKHPFEGSPTLPASQDTTANTLMSYDSVGGTYSTFRPFDVAALMWIYGGDGLGGALGVNSTGGGRYLMGTSAAETLTGTSANDTLRGEGGNDAIDGGAGTDTVVLNGARSAYTGAQLAPGTITLGGGADGVDTYTNVELFSFSDGTVSLANLFSGTISGTAGADLLLATSGNNAIDGGAGIDTVQFATARSGFTVVRSGTTVTVTDNAGDGGIDTLLNVERLKFGDASVAVDIDGNGGKAYRVYQAAFDRAPDAGGVGFWMFNLDSGVSLVDIAAGFMASPEFLAMYGANPSTTEFVSKLYENILNRPGEAAGINFWVGVIDGNHATRAAVLADFSGQAENIALVGPTIQNGFVFTPWVG
jgi:hypothetical protein